VAGRVDCRPLEFSNFSTSESFLGGDPLAQEILGFFFFGVPLLQLFGTKEAYDALTNRVAICNNLADDVGFGRVGILFHVLCDLFSCFRKSGMKFLLLIVGEI
jgi:hypothetical protein